MAIGSRRITPTWQVAAAVVSEPIEAPTSTPWAQSRASNTSGTSDARRPPHTIAEIGTPCAASACGEYDGHCFALTVKRELGCAALPLTAAKSTPCPSLTGTTSSQPSHPAWLTSVTAALVEVDERGVRKGRGVSGPFDLSGPRKLRKNK